MTERARTPLGRAGRVVAGLGPLGFLIVLAVGVSIGRLDGLALGVQQSEPAAAFQSALDVPSARGRVLVAFDADIGSYAEIRPAVRAALAEVAGHGASLSFVSFSPEGRALALGELDRLSGGGVEDTRLLDLGFRAGAEAGLIGAVRSIVPASASGTLADGLRDGGGGIAAFDLVLIIGGTEIGPRSWMEQVAPRLPALPTVAIVPTVLQPLAVPYLRTEQLTALLASTRDDAAYVELVRGDPGLAGREATTITDLPPSALPILLGMLVTLGALAEAIARRWGSSGPEAAA